MFSALAVVLPIFALLFAGWLAQRIGVLGPNSTTELNRFVIYLALPALLFDIVAHTGWVEIWQPRFAAAFGFGALIVFGLTFVVAVLVISPTRPSTVSTRAMPPPRKANTFSSRSTAR